jgi:hypothetical protein
MMGASGCRAPTMPCPPVLMPATRTCDIHHAPARGVCDTCGMRHGADITVTFRSRARPGFGLSTVDNREGVGKSGTFSPADLRDFALRKGLAGDAGPFHRSRAPMRLRGRVHTAAQTNESIPAARHSHDGTRTTAMTGGRKNRRHSHIVVRIAGGIGPRAAAAAQ